MFRTTILLKIHHDILVLIIKVFNKISSNGDKRVTSNAQIVKEK